MTEHHFENIGWTVGNHCNASCGHCYSWKVRKDSSEFLTHDDVDRVVEQLVRLGIKTVNLGGNEPIYTHGTDIRQTILPYIIRTLSEANMPVGLTTNGASFFYLDKNHHDELLLINDIDFSLDSPFAIEHDLTAGPACIAWSSGRSNARSSWASTAVSSRAACGPTSTRTTCPRSWRSRRCWAASSASTR